MDQDKLNELFKFINNTPEVLSLLYDLNLLPELLEPESQQWKKMIHISTHIYMLTQRIKQETTLLNNSGIRIL